ncbi:hypothetical protein D3C85_1636840 [compost metagenome]
MPSGILPVLAAISGSGPGVLASRVERAFWLWRKLVSSWGMPERVPRYWVLACCTSSSALLPLLNSRSVISRLRC